MLVSKIKPCMCKIGIVWPLVRTLLICGRLIKQVMNLATWYNPSGMGITLSTAAIMPSKSVNAENIRVWVNPPYFGTCSLLTIESESLRFGCKACFESFIGGREDMFLIYQPGGWVRSNLGYYGYRGLVSNSGERA